METLPTEVIEVAAEVIDYVPAFQKLIMSNQNIEELLGYLVSFDLFFVVVLLCYFGYKFLRIFF